MTRRSNQSRTQRASVRRARRQAPLPASVVVGAASFGALGLAVSTIVPNVETTDAAVMATLLPVTFISGGFMPVRDGTLLATIADAFPVRHLLVAGQGAVWSHLAVVAAWGAVGAARRFRWTPSPA